MAKYRVLATRQLLGGKKRGTAAAKLQDRGSLELPKLPPKLLEEHVRSQPTYLENQHLVGMVSPAYAVVEAAGVVTLEVERTATTMPLMVDFSTLDLTATAGEDYEATSGTLKYKASRRDRICHPSRLRHPTPAQLRYRTETSYHKHQDL